MILKILNKLEKESSGKKKIEILNANASNNLLKECFSAALNPFVNYFILKIPEVNESSAATITLDYALEELKKLSSRELTGNKAISHLKDILASLNEDDRQVVVRIIRRDMRCGTAEATVNKIWPNLIPSYPCLLGHPYNSKTIKKITFPAIAQTKSDGMRVNITCHRDEQGTVEVSIKGRSGKDVDLKGSLDDAFKSLGMTIGRNVVFDGELVVLGKNGTVLDRKTGNGILNKAIRGDISEDEASRVVMHMWDIIPYDDFQARLCSTPYVKRLELLRDRVKNTPSSRYSIIDTHTVNNLAEAEECYANALASGEEGIMLKNLNSVWEDKRSTHVLKFKSEKICELRVKGFNYGNIGTKWEHGLGSLICASEDGLLEVDVSGFTDALRIEIFNNIQDWIGSIVSIKYNELIQSKDPKVKTSLFLPRFAGKRLDKSTADTIDLIQ